MFAISSLKRFANLAASPLRAIVLGLDADLEAVQISDLEEIGNGDIWDKTLSLLVVFLYINRLVFYTLLKCRCHLGRQKYHINFTVKQFLQFILNGRPRHVAWRLQ